MKIKHQYLKVVISEQKLYSYEDKMLCRKYDISSSQFGIGSRKNSYKTPLGRHKIIDKIGDGVPSGGIFKQRKYTGRNCYDSIGSGDMITTRILILEGLEPDVNSGEGICSKERCIWIHGTQEEDLIGQPASHGCIRMKNKDIIELYSRVSIGAEVDIQR
jgi:L,D-transpeptidase-like protein